MQPKVRDIKPPRAHEIEIRVLSALTYIGNHSSLRVQEAMLKLDNECFGDIFNIAVFETIHELFKLKKDFSTVALLEAIPENLYLFVNESVRQEYFLDTHLESDVEILLAYRAWRKQLKILTDSINLSFSATTPQESLDCIMHELQKINKSSSATRKSYIRSYETIADELLSETFEDDSEFKVDIQGVPPVPNRSLITIAGRSGHGKTFWALYLMDKIIDAKPGKQTLYFNLEMHERVMMERHAKLLGVQGRNRIETISNGIAQLIDKNVSLISEPMITIEEIEAECRLAALRQPIAVIVVDYLQLIRSRNKSESKHLEQSDIAKRLAALAMELNCVVIDLIQVNRDFKTRPVGDRCPMPQDSAESMGSVHSSSWWLGIDQPQNDSQDPEWEHMFMIQCRKNRGDSGMFGLRLEFRNGMFGPWKRPFSRSYATKTAELSGF